MPSPEMHTMSRAIGDLEATVRNISTQWREQEKNASEGRRQLYGRFEGLALQMQQISSKVDNLSHELREEVLPTIEAYKLSVARQSGALFAGKLMWAFIAGVFGAIGFGIHEVAAYLKGH